MPHNLIIIQARNSSTRLPGKVLKPLWRGMNLLDLQLEKLKDCGVPYVLATTVNPSDDTLFDWAQKNKVEVFRGEEQNVLKRFIDCANQYQAQNLIRVCSDNPFIQLESISDYLHTLEQGVDYVSYCNESGIPAIKTHWGLFVEGVKLTALEKASEMLEAHSDKNFYSEHVTNFIYENPEQFKVKLDMAPQSIVSRHDLRFTIDTEEDFNNMADLLELVHGAEGLEHIVEMVDTKPNVLKRMQKGIQSFKK